MSEVPITVEVLDDTEINNISKTEGSFLDSQEL